MQPSLIQVLDADAVLDAADLGDIGAEGNSLYFYRPKTKVKKIIFNTAKVGNQLKFVVHSPASSYTL